jgi:transcriptional regulator with XRE-family HTH domain
MMFVDLLRKLKEDRGLSESRLARLSGVPRGTLHNYLRGRRLPTFPVAVALARGLGVSLDALAAADDLCDAYLPAEELPPQPRRRRPKPGRVALTQDKASAENEK